MIKRYYAYAIPPIDWWYGMPTVSELIEKIAKEKHEEEHKEESPSTYFNNQIKYIATLESDALAVLKYSKINGYVENEGISKIFHLPCSDFEVNLGFAIKQFNNGNTFIVSPISLTTVFDEGILSKNHPFDSRVIYLDGGKEVTPYDEENSTEMFNIIAEDALAIKSYVIRCYNYQSYLREKIPYDTVLNSESEDTFKEIHSWLSEKSFKQLFFDMTHNSIALLKVF